MKTQKRKRISFNTASNLLLMFCYDFCTIILSFLLALWLRYDCSFSFINEEYFTIYRLTIPVYAVFAVIIFWCFKLYQSLWASAGYGELKRLCFTTAFTVIAYMANMYVINIFVENLYMPVSYYIFGGTFQLIFAFVIRFTYKFILVSHKSKSENAKRVIIFGAGSAGQLLLKDIKTNVNTDMQVVCILDDDQRKWGKYIDGVRIYGGRESILIAANECRADIILIAIPSATTQQRRDIINICNETECELLNLPGLYQLYRGEITISKMKKVDIEDLLGRAPITTDMTDVFNYIKDKVVLVTGVGSIGSELCRQIAAHSPKHLIMFDVYENNAYDIQQELRKLYPTLRLSTIIGSVRDSRKIMQVFVDYKPDIVYHAAAHKHVPLMEDSPCEAIKNNALGTYKTALAAATNGCKRFVLISTDKAVNPTNVMGASKRLCEMIVQSFDAKIKAGKAEEIPALFTHGGDEFFGDENIKINLKNSKTEFVAVRFGNVLGSNGSVIPLFKKQIEAGGPVTVTHPDIIRYFMTIPEAVRLVLLAGTHANGGEIFVLDMGEPVKIDDLARNLIKLSGYKPDVDIKVVYSGLRPGEKLFEEKLMAEEGLKRTKNDLIHIGCPIPFDTDMFFTQLYGIMEAAYDNDTEIRDKLKTIVTTFHPAN